MDYELLGKSGRHAPLRAFRETRVTVDLAGDGEELHVIAEISLDRKRSQPVLERLEFQGYDAPLRQIGRVRQVGPPSALSETSWPR